MFRLGKMLKAHSMQSGPSNATMSQRPYWCCVGTGRYLAHGSGTKTNIQQIKKVQATCCSQRHASEREDRTELQPSAE